MKHGIVFRRKGHKELAGWRGWFFIGAVALIAFIPFELPLLIGAHELSGFNKTTSESSQMQFLLRVVIPFVVTAVVGALAILATVRARLEVTAFGMRHISGLPRIFSAGNWALRWNEIQAVTLGATFGQPMIRVRTASGIKTLGPLQWVDPLEAGNAPPRGAGSEPPLIRILKARGVLKENESGSTEDPGDINSNFTAQVIVGCFIALVGYFIFDIYFGLKEFYASAVPYGWLVGFGAIGAGFAVGALRFGKVGTRDAVLIGILFGGGVGLAGYPLLLRVNAWTDQGGLHAHSYVLQNEEGVWMPREAGLPVLHFGLRSGYWEQFQPGAEKSFELRQGGLGFFQVNFAPIYDEQKNYYKNHGR